MWNRLRKPLGTLVISAMLIMPLSACGGSNNSAATTVPTTGAVATVTTGGGSTTDTTPTTGGGGTTDTTPTVGGGTTDTTPTVGGAMGGETPTTVAGGTGGGFTSGGPITLPENCANTEVAYWTPLSGPDGEAMTKLTDQFNSANSNVKVNITTGSFTDYNTQLSTAAASNTLPDIAIINEDQVATQAFRNILRPIPDDVVKMIGVSVADYPEVAWNAGQVAGKTYAIPLSFVAMTMYYNEDLLKAAGISAPPTDKATFEAAAQAMTKDGNNGFLLTNGFPVQQVFQMLLHQYGGTEFNADGSKATWNSDAGVQALTWMKEASGKYGQPNLEVDAELNAFKTGTVGLIWNGIWQVPSLTGSAVSFAGKPAPVPQIGPQPAVWAGGPLLTFTKKTADSCKDTVSAMFYKHLIDNSVEWAKGGNIPANNKARETAEFKALPHAAVGPSVASPVFPPSVPGIGDAFAPLGTQVGAVLSGNAPDIKAALDTAAQQADSILAENKKNYGDAPQP